MPAYVIADNKVIHPDKYAEYARLSAPTHKLYGGKVLAAGDGAECLGGDWEPRRVVILEFESMEKARAWAESVEYHDAKAVRDSAADVRMILVEGRPAIPS